MITTVTLNPAIDQTIIVDKVVLGTVHKVRIRRMDVGGKGINVSKVISLLGGDSVAIGYLGRENKRFFEDFFEEYGINHDFVLVDGSTRTNTKIIDLSEHQTTEFNEIGFAIFKNDVEELKTKIRNYQGSSKYVVFSGSMGQGNYKGLFGEYLSQINDHNKIVIDATGDMLLEGVKHSPFLIKPNVDELKSTFGLESTSIDGLIKEAIIIKQKFGIRWILLSMGSEGAALISDDMVLRANAVKVEVKSAVGAGDSMLGGFIYAFDKFGDAKKAFKYAMACGAAAVTTEGTELFDKSLVMDLYTKVQVEDMSALYFEI